MYGSWQAQSIYLLFFSEYDIIPKLVEIAKSAVKEKVIRVIIATLRVS